jgi:exodeoxyribonuclease VII small subunit
MAEEERTFEAIFAELEATVQRLEAGDLSLAESLALYERATALAEQCNLLLDEAELRVRQLTARAGGEVEAEPFDGWPGGGPT